MSPQAAVELCHRYCDLFSNLTPETLDQFKAIVSDDIHFKDPFNDVRDFNKMKQILSEMFEHTDGPAFNVYEQNVFDDHAWLRWQFNATLPVIGLLSVDGASRISMDLTQGRVIEHIDYWDSAPIYMRLPLLGLLLRQIRKRMSAK
ncbi:nuclear transport factor 2 family protein [Nitrincola schmidtii]|uniref:nuclear transport factor 2 family protein n=1 Tax=Nitrincola schmidtii TaxID=1730894 RepID=UPI00124CB1AA|nr:nuclear transport factor 2 family protein [Nitrincola schmidtii]